MSLTFMEKWTLRRLQLRIIRMENMQNKLKIWINLDRKEAKKLLMRDVDNIIKQHTTPGALIELCPSCKKIKEVSKKCSSCKK